MYQTSTPIPFPVSLEPSFLPLWRGKHCHSPDGRFKLSLSSEKQNRRVSVQYFSRDVRLLFFFFYYLFSPYASIPFNRYDTRELLPLGKTPFWASFVSQYFPNGSLDIFLAQRDRKSWAKAIVTIKFIPHVIKVFDIRLRIIMLMFVLCSQLLIENHIMTTKDSFISNVT